MHITITGFKSLRETQAVAIGGKITFLVGPNSAGKSVVAQAIQLLNGDSPMFELNEKFIHINPNSEIDVPVHALGVEWTKFGKDVYQYHSGYAESKGYEGRYNDTAMNSIYIIYALNGNFLIAEKGNEHLNPQKISMAFDPTYEKFLQEISKKRRSYKNDYPYLRHSSYTNDHTIDIKNAWGDEKTKAKLLECGTWLHDLYKIMEEKSKNREDGIAKEIAERREILKDVLNEGRMIWNSGDIHLYIYIIFDKREKQYYLNSLEKYSGIISRYKRKVHDFFAKMYPGKNFGLALVSGSRSLPCKEDKEAQFSLHEKNIQNIYHELMQSCAVASVNITENNFFASQELAKEVNRALADYLFTEIGYQIETRAYLMLEPRFFGALEDRIKYSDYIGSMRLRDSHGRYLDFEEVGAGIGYVLPVLIECFRPGNKDQIVFLQQPELHLHPSLQANLTDVMIEAAADRRIIAETHSEHLILRALRRVRQTTNGTLKDPALALRAEDVAVNYFEPLPTGETRVHVLRVSDDGDFIDPWPNGFFAERDRELFDE